MDYLIIILGIVLFLLVYYIYTIVTAVPTVGNNINLTQPPIMIKSSSIKNPYSSNYSIGVWIYISDFGQNNQIDRFLMYGDRFYSGKNSMFSLRMDTNKPILYCDILVNSTSSNKYATQSVPLNTTDESFPVQKWTYVVVSTNYSFIESYINGRFVSAVKVADSGLFVANVPANPEYSATFTFGAKGVAMDNGVIRQIGCPIVLTGLSRWDTPLSAGDVYDLYSKGNGYGPSFLPAYHMNINIKKDKENYVLPIF